MQVEAAVGRQLQRFRRQQPPVGRHHDDLRAHFGQPFLGGGGTQAGRLEHREAQLQRRRFHRGRNGLTAASARAVGGRNHPGQLHLRGLVQSQQRRNHELRRSHKNHSHKPINPICW